MTLFKEVCRCIAGGDHPARGDVGGAEGGGDVEDEHKIDPLPYRRSAHLALHRIRKEQDQEGNGQRRTPTVQTLETETPGCFEAEERLKGR
jgi:hypothetical protein